MRLCGQASSMAIITMFLSLYIGRNMSFETADIYLLTKGSRLSFVVFTVLYFMGIFTFLARGKIYN